MSQGDPSKSTDASPPVKMRAISPSYSPHFLPVLESLGGTLLISTYESGHLVSVGAKDAKLRISFHGFEHVMGMAVAGQGNPGQPLAVGTAKEVWYLASVPEMAPRIEPAGTYDGCLLARRAHFTGQIDCHELAWGGSELWVVNTLFSCLCTLDSEHSFVPRWKPPFIKQLVAEDRCHLNGLAMVDQQPKYVTAFAESNTGEGWRPTKATTGRILEVPTGETICTGLAMPHSPRWYDSRLWVLNSGRGELGFVDRATGRFEKVETLPGYTRGLAFAGPFAFVGLSKIRDRSTFGGLPIEDRRAELRCGVAVVDLRIGQSVAYIEFREGIDEIFDVQFVPGVSSLFISGPNPTEDGANALWVVPPLSGALAR